MFIDDLPVWGMVGEKDTGMIFTHKSFHIKYNKDRVIEVQHVFYLFIVELSILNVQVNYEPFNALPLKAGVPFEFTYSVEFEETTDVFEERFDRYLDNKVDWGWG